MKCGALKAARPKDCRKLHATIIFLCYSGDLFKAYKTCSSVVRVNSVLMRDLSLPNSSGLWTRVGLRPLMWSITSSSLFLLSTQLRGLHRLGLETENWTWGMMSSFPYLLLLPVCFCTLLSVFLYWANLSLRDTKSTVPSVVGTGVRRPR